MTTLTIITRTIVHLPERDSAEYASLREVFLASLESPLEGDPSDFDLVLAYTPDEWDKELALMLTDSRESLRAELTAAGVPAHRFIGDYTEEVE